MLIEQCAKLKFERIGKKTDCHSVRFVIKCFYTFTGGFPLYQRRLSQKLREALKAVIPIMAVVIALSFSVAPMPGGVLLAFLFGGGLLTAGMMLFTLGAELAMAPMGERIGAKVTKTRKLWLVLLLGLALGVMITVSEPDLQVLAQQVPSIPNLPLILSVAAGVGLFLVAAMLRMLFGVPLRILLLVCYAAVFALAFFAPKSFLAVAFDGVSAIRTDRHAYNDSFGLVATCSIGPILAVLVLSLIYAPKGADYTAFMTPDIGTSADLGQLLLRAAPKYMGETALALLPIAVFFAVFQLVSLKLEKQTLLKIGVGVIYTYVGLVIFLTGVNVGFLPVGAFLGRTLGALTYRWILIPIGALTGWFIVRAEPSVYVLTAQVEELTEGSIGGRSLQLSLSAGVTVSVALAMVRVLTGVSVLWFVLPGYALALGLSFFTPKIFTAIAFDAGGVASGPMTTTFVLPLAVGACIALGGDIVTDAFGVVSMVAMTPIITIQILGLVYKLRGKPAAEAAEADTYTDIGEYEIVEL